MQRSLGAPDVDAADPEFGIKGANKEEGGARGGTRFRTLFAWHKGQQVEIPGASFPPTMRCVVLGLVAVIIVGAGLMGNPRADLLISGDQVSSLSSSSSLDATARRVRTRYVSGYKEVTIPVSSWVRVCPPARLATARTDGSASATRRGAVIGLVRGFDDFGGYAPLRERSRLVVKNLVRYLVPAATPGTVRIFVRTHAFSRGRCAARARPNSRS